MSTLVDSLTPLSLTLYNDTPMSLSLVYINPFLPQVMQIILCELLQINHFISFSMINVTTVCPTIDNNRKGATLYTPMDKVTGLSRSSPSSLRNLMMTI